MTEDIKRAAVFEQFDNGEADVIEMYPDGSVDFGFGASNIRDQINAIPAADVAPVTHWVLADEKLPPDGQDVLCWYEYFRFGSYHQMFQTYGIGYQYNGMWGGEVAQGQKARVLAWIPLPEAPKIDGGTENAS